MRRVREEAQDKDSGFARLKEELGLLLKQKEDAEAKLKRFEGKFRQAMQEAEELRT
jgi:hypothetical protein